MVVLGIFNKEGGEMAFNNSSLEPPSIVVKDLSYKFQDGTPGLVDINLDLPAGSRTLLIGGRLKQRQEVSIQRKKKLIF